MQHFFLRLDEKDATCQTSHCTENAIMSLSMYCISKMQQLDGPCAQV